MKDDKITVGIAVFLALILTSAIGYVGYTLGYAILSRNTQPLTPEQLAKELTAQGAKMYGASWCGHCKEQKEAFGEAWKYVTYVECSAPEGEQTPACVAADIQGYPTWIFKDGSRLEGKQSFDVLQAKL